MAAAYKSITQTISARIPALAVLLVVSLAAMALPLLATARGEVIVTPDGVSYISAARSFAAGAGFRDFGDNSFTFWTPLYPIILAGLSNVSPNLLDAARLLNALTFGGIVFVSGLIFWRDLDNKIFALIGLLLVVFSQIYVTNSVHALSEPLFTLFILIFLWTLPRVKNWRGLIALAVIAALMCLQRYMGVIAVVVGGLSLLLMLDTVPLRRRLLYSVTLGVVALTPVALWLLRNVQLTGSLVRSSSGGSRPLIDVLTLTRDTLFRWILPEGIAMGVPVVVGMILLLLMILWAGIDSNPSPKSPPRKRRGDLKAATRAAPPLYPGGTECRVVGGRGAGGEGDNTRRITISKWFPSALLVLMYTAALIIATLRPNYGPIGSRLLSPIYTPFILILLVAGERIAAWLNKRFNSVAPGYVIALVIAAASLPPAVSKTIEQVDTLDGWCCSEARAHQNDVIAWLRANPMTERAYTNSTLPLYYTRFYSARLPNDPAEIEPPALLIWFSEDLRDLCKPGRYCNPPTYTFDDLNDEFDLEILFESPDGGVYRIMRRGN